MGARRHTKARSRTPAPYSLNLLQTAGGNAMCVSTGKRRHGTEEDALAHLADMQAVPAGKHQKGHAPTRVYLCVMCDSWHTRHDHRVNEELANAIAAEAWVWTTTAIENRAWEVAEDASWRAASSVVPASRAHARVPSRQLPPTRRALGDRLPGQ